MDDWRVLDGSWMAGLSSSANSAQHRHLLQARYGVSLTRNWPWELCSARVGGEDVARLWQMKGSVWQVERVDASGRAKREEVGIVEREV